MQYVFVDESKAKDYLLAAAVINDGGLGPRRSAINQLRRKGQPRIHMVAEGETSRKTLLRTIDSMDDRILVYQAKRGDYPNEKARRYACLDQLVADVAAHGEARICLERDASLVSWDLGAMLEIVRKYRCSDTVTYYHESARAEPLLVIPDAVAWSWARKGEWLALCRPMVDQFRSV